MNNPSFLCLTVVGLLMLDAHPSTNVRYSGAIPPNPATIKLDSNQTLYFKYVNLAARDIYSNDFITAGCDYEEAFKHKAHPFYVDIRNAILVNIKCGTPTKNLPLLKTLMADKHLDTACLFMDLPQRIFDQNSRDYILQLQVKLYSKKSIPGKLAEGLDRIYGVEQELLKSALTSPMHTPFVQDSIQMAKALIHEQNALEFIRLCNLYGFPSEERVGVYYDKETSWADVLYSLTGSFVHTAQKEKLFELLETARLAGDLHPSLYASLMDLEFRNSRELRKECNFMNTPVILTNGKSYRPFIYYSDSLMRTVNTNRVSIGLDSFHVVQKQVACIQLYQKYHAEDMAGKKLVPMAPYARMDALDYGFIKWAFDKEKQDITKYELNVKKIQEESNCREKLY